MHVISGNSMIQEKPTAGIILAAGASTRLGQPKQLLRLKEKYLLEWVLDAALNSRLSKIILVLGYSHQRIRQALGNKCQHPRLLIKLNTQFKEGQSQSLQTGLSAVKDDFAAVIFLLGDQPLLKSETINALLEKFWSTDKDICVPTYQGTRKNPTVFGRRFYPQLMDIRGDRGARQLIDTHPGQVETVEMHDALCFFDVDTQNDFKQLKTLLTT